MRAAALRATAPPPVLSTTVAVGLITAETVGLLLLKGHNPEAAFAALYLVGLIVVYIVWGLASALVTAVASGLALASFHASQGGQFALLSLKSVSVIAVLSVLAVLTHVVGTRVRAHQAQAEGDQRSPRVDRIVLHHQMIRLRIGSSTRLGAVAILFAATVAGTPRGHWGPQLVLIGLYAVAAVWAARVSFSSAGPSKLTLERLLTLALADVTVVFGFELLSHGGLLPLSVLVLVPLLLVPYMSWRGTAVMMLVALGAFVIILLRDAAVAARLGSPQTLLVISLYTAVCCIGLAAAYVQERHLGEIAGLVVSREALLASTMTATDELQRGVAESIHDGTLQDIMVARQELLDLAETSPNIHVDRALASLEETTTRLRRAIFELHPVVVEQLGLGPAIEKLALDVGQRSGIETTTEIEETTATDVDSMLFGVVRELLSNAGRHSHATHISVSLAVIGDSYRIDVADNGIGLSPQAAVERLAEGHIGLATHRARVEGANGSFTVVDEPQGTHIRIDMPVSPTR